MVYLFEKKERKKTYDLTVNMHLFTLLDLWLGSWLHKMECPGLFCVYMLWLLAHVDYGDCAGRLCVSPTMAPKHGQCDRKKG